VQLEQDPCAVPPGYSFAGLTVVGAAKALGVLHMRSGQSLVDWEALLAKVEKRYAAIAALPVSMFGRGIAAGAYGLSRLLYAAEFVGLPAPAHLQRLQALTAKLVDRGQAPADTERDFAGIRAQLLVGHPSEGGCGVLPLEQHITARHARWALRLLHGDASVPWVQVAQHVLAPTRAPDAALWRAGIAMCMDAARGPAGARLPAPLARLAAAMHALPPWQLLQAVEPVQAPGPWCASAPLWCNPQLTVQGPGMERRVGLAVAFAGLAQLGTITTVKEALTALAEVTAAWPYERYLATAFPFWLRGSEDYLDRQTAIAHLTALVNSIPQAWRDAAAAATTPQLPPTREVQAQALGRVGWVGVGPHPVESQAATVKQLALLQLGPLRAAREAKWAGFLADAGQGAPPGEAPTAAELQRLLRRLWKLRWDNQRKEVYWRLVLDGLPNATRFAHADETCGCGAAGPGRLHHYWQCPVAQAVVQAMQAEMPQLQQQLLPVHVWLARAPAGWLHRGVWRVVALSAVLAMEKGRQLLYKWQKQSPHQPCLQLSPQQLQLAAAVAVATLWDMVADWVGLGLYPATWALEMPVGHPFVAPVAGALQVRPPVAPVQQ
jgi:hypothetical protein